MEAYKIHRDIACIDLKSFYASVECVERGLDPFKTPLIVADASRGGGSIILAVSPFLKARGIPGRLRLHEMPPIPDLIIAKPRMKKYLAYSRMVIGVYLDYVSKDDLHIYSVDEAFLDLTPYLRYYDCDALCLTRRIMKSVYQKTKIPSSAGIGDNMLLSKLALDLKSKKSKSHIAAIRYADVEKDLWPVRPLSKMWGIGKRMEKRLNLLGIYRVGDLAQAKTGTLKKLFGVIGEELYYHAHGIDQAIISEKHRDTKPVIKSVGMGQTLFKDYDATMVFPILLEMADEVCERLRFIRTEAQTIHLSVGYSQETGGGFSRQMKLAHPSDVPHEVLDAVLTLFDRFYDDAPIRRITIRATKLQDARMMTQLSLFEKVERRQKEKALFESLDHIKRRFGKKSAMRLTSYLDHATAKERATMIGGHHG